MVKKLRFGYCPVCNAPTVYYAQDPWLRDNYRCIRCKSIPRQRALMMVLHAMQRSRYVRV